ncbi:MAG: ribonuclease HII [Nanoarchaeota archaeon]
MLLLGIDDAGRGPLIGPMFLAGVLLEKKDEAMLKTEGVADSKLLSHSTRIKLSVMIKDIALDYHIVEAKPEQIDHAIKSRINLNTLEAIKTAEIINKINKRKEKIKVIVDCPSVNTKAWKNTLYHYIKNIDNLEIICEHKADFNYPVVSAASILAKVAREDEVEKIKKKFGDIGSGYPSDPITIKFLKEHGDSFKDSGIFRKSWKTWKSIFPESDQKLLDGFFR